MQPCLIAQIKIFFGQFIKSELSDAERYVSPLLFALIILILFSFSFASIPSDLQVKVQVAVTFLTVFLALQINFSRAFEPDQQDQAFNLLKTYPIFPGALFISKFMIVFILSILILLPTILLSAFLNHQSTQIFLSWSIFFLSLLVLFGLTAIGVLLSVIMLNANSRQILFPLLYFPLTVPILIASTEASLEIVENGRNLTDLFPSWLGLLLIFDTVYFTIAILLFGELIGFNANDG